MKFGVLFARNYELKVFLKEKTYFAEVKKIGNNRNWTAEIKDFKPKDFEEISRLPAYARFFEICEDKKVISYHKGLSGGGCCGSKAKVLNSGERKKEVLVTRKEIVKNSQDEKTEQVSNILTEKKEVNETGDIKIDDLMKIFDALENFDIYRTKLRVFKKLDFFKIKSINKVLSLVLTRLSLNNSFMNLDSMKEKIYLLIIVKNLMISSFFLEDQSVDQSILIGSLNQVKGLVDYFKKINSFSNQSEVLMNLFIIYDLLKDYKEIKEKFQGRLEKNLGAKDRLSFIISISKDCSPVDYSLKYFAVKYFQNTGFFSQREVQDLLKTDLEILKDLDKVKVFEILTAAVSLFKTSVISYEFLLERFLKFSALTENSDNFIRQVAVSFFKRLAGSKNSLLSSSASALLNQIFDQEKDFIIKTEIPCFSRTDVKSVKFHTNIDLHYLSFSYANGNEAKKIFETLNEQFFIGIFGESSSGKKTLAFQYCKKAKNSYNYIWSINSDQPDHDIKDLCEVLDIPNNKESKKLLKKKLESQENTEKFLFVFHGSDSLEKVEEIVRKSEYVHNVFITRNQIWKNSINLNLIDPDYIEYASLLSVCSQKRKSKQERIKEVFGNYFIGYKLIYSIELNDEIDGVLDSTQSNLTKDTLLALIVNKFVREIDEVTRFLLEILSYINPYSISEQFIHQLFLEKYSEQQWDLSKSVLLHKSLIKVHEVEHPYWVIHISVYSVITELERTTEANDVLINYFYTISVKNTRNEFTNPLLYHILSFIYQTDIKSYKELAIATQLIKDLQTAGFDKKSIIELIEILDDKATTLKQTNNTLELLSFFKTLGNLSESLNSLEYALELYKKYYEDLNTQNLKNSEAISTCIYIAELGEKIEDTETSLKYYEKSTEFQDLSSELISKVYSSYGMALSSQNNWEKSEEVLRSGLSKLNSSDFSLKYPLYSELAYISTVNEDFSSALNINLTVKEALEKSNKINTLEYSKTLISLAELYISESSHQKAVDLLKKSLDIFQRLLPSNHPDLIYPNALLADLLKTDPCYLSYYKSFRESFESYLSNSIELIDMNFEDFYTSKSIYKRSDPKIKKGLLIFSGFSNSS